MLRHMVACSESVVWMKVDDYSRETFSVEQVLVASASRLLMVAGLEGSDLAYLYFLFQKVVNTEM